MASTFQYPLRTIAIRLPPTKRLDEADESSPTTKKMVMMKARRCELVGSAAPSVLGASTLDAGTLSKSMNAFGLT